MPFNKRNATKVKLGATPYVPKATPYAPKGPKGPKKAMKYRPYRETEPVLGKDGVWRLPEGMYLGKRFVQDKNFPDDYGNPVDLFMDFTERITGYDKDGKAITVREEVGFREPLIRERAPGGRNGVKGDYVWTGDLELENCSGRNYMVAEGPDTLRREFYFLKYNNPTKDPEGPQYSGLWYGSYYTPETREMQSMNMEDELYRVCELVDVLTGMRDGAKTDAQREFCEEGIERAITRMGDLGRMMA